MGYGIGTSCQRQNISYGLFSPTLRRIANKLPPTERVKVFTGRKNVKGTYGMDVRRQTKELAGYINGWFTNKEKRNEKPKR